MPEQLSKLGLPHTMIIGDEKNRGAFHARPHLASAAMDVITAWSLLELDLSALFIKMLGANPLPGAAIYSSLTSTAAQKSALRAVAGTLPTNHRDVFEVILGIFGTVAKSRNKLAHWIHGWTKADEGCVLLADPAAFANMAATNAHFRHEKKDAVADWPADKVYVWRLKDFEEVSRETHELREFVLMFSRTIGEDPTRFGLELQKLIDVPLIRERLLRLQKRRKSDPEAPE